MSAASAAATHALTWRAATTPGASVEWGTPPAIYLALDQEFDFTLDAAASALNAKHIRHLTKAEDALRVPWIDERVFCNPPYGKALKAWTEKALHECRENGSLVVMLIPSRTDTIWFHQNVLPWAEIRFIKGRLGYTKDGSNTAHRAPFASMVVIYRPPLERSLEQRQQLLFPFMPKVLR